MELSLNAQLIIKDMFGHTVKSVEMGQVSQYSLGVGDIANGIYFCTLISNNKTLEVQKFSILK
jgi:hypothetical protein